jgi:hypothetical protein
VVRVAIAVDGNNGGGIVKIVHRLVLIAVVLGGFGPQAARATFHEIDVNEVYSNADGTIQYVELISRFPVQTNLAQTRIVARNADGTQTTLLFNFTATFTSGTLNNGDTLLIATPGFEAVAGFAPDFVMPASSLISFLSGRVLFETDDGLFIVDSVAYGDYLASNVNFGLAAVGLPCDGVHSLTRISSSTPLNNAVDFVVRTNSPRRNDGTNTTLHLPLGTDCNRNGVPDACDIASGDSLDHNGNHVPDDCEYRADFDRDGDVDLDDYRRLQGCLDGPDGGILPGCDGQDVTGDDVVDFLDFAEFQNSFGTPPP